MCYNSVMPGGLLICYKFLINWMISFFMPGRVAQWVGHLTRKSGV